MEQGKALKSIKCCRSRRRKKMGESSRNGRVSSHNSGLRSFARKVSWEFFGRWTRISKAFAINFLKCSSDLFSKNVRAATQSQGRVPRVSAPRPLHPGPRAPLRPWPWARQLSLGRKVGTARRPCPSRGPCSGLEPHAGSLGTAQL